MSASNHQRNHCPKPGQNSVLAQTRRSTQDAGIELHNEEAAASAEARVITMHSPNILPSLRNGLGVAGDRAKNSSLRIMDLPLRMRNTIYLLAFSGKLDMSTSLALGYCCRVD
jgi:hypothetical protein